MTRLFMAAVLCAAIGFGAVSADAASARTCRPVVNPYPNTRYEGVDLTSIRATGVSCRVARRVARRAHRKALRIAPSPDGVRRFRWRAWRVRGDLRGPNDRYLARRGGDRVRWIF